MADHPLRPATDHRLGRPLPHQLANRTRAPPRAINLSPMIAHRAYAVLAEVSLGYPPLQGRFPRATHPCATKAEAFVRLACVRHAASVRSEPGSNSHVQSRSAPRTGREPNQGPLNASLPTIPAAPCPKAQNRGPRRSQMQTHPQRWTHTPRERRRPAPPPAHPFPLNHNVNQQYPTHREPPLGVPPRREGGL